MISARPFALGLIGVVVACVLWEIAGQYFGDSLFAPFSSVMVEYLSLLKDGRMLRELQSSLLQMLVGFGLAFLLGAPLGIAMGRSKTIEALIQPWLSMFVVTSVAALVPVFLVVLGTGFGFRVAVVFTSSVGYIAIATFHGALGIDQRWINVGRSFRAGRIGIFRHIILPSMFPYLITGARLGLIHAIRAMVMAEMFVVIGFGGLIYESGLAISTAPLLGLLLTLMIVGVAANALLFSLGRKLAPWYKEEHHP